MWDFTQIIERPQGVCHDTPMYDGMICDVGRRSVSDEGVLCCYPECNLCGFTRRISKAQFDMEYEERFKLAV